MSTKPYDSAWKEAIELYFEAFMRLLFPDIADKIDWSRGYQLLDKELRQLAADTDGEPEHGTKGREADALLQLAKNDGQEIWVLVHVEVQTQRDPDFPRRMFFYHYRIRDRYAKDVCSLAVLGDKSAGWRPSSYKSELWGSRVEFHFPTAKLPDLKAGLVQLEHSTNPVAILVRPICTPSTQSHIPPLAVTSSFECCAGFMRAGWTESRSSPSSAWSTGYSSCRPATITFSGAN